MDATDIALCQLLQTNSRTPYHELAGRLGLSTNAVHKRIKELKEAGIIRAFRARPSLEAVKGINVWVFGRSGSGDLGNLHRLIQKNDSAYWLAVSGGGYIYVGGYVRGISRLPPFVSFVKKTGGLHQPTVGVFPLKSQPHSIRELRPLDREVLRVLHSDSRRPAVEVARQLGVSAKTVKRRLEWMSERRLLDLTMDWYPDASNDVMAVTHVEVRNPAMASVVSLVMRESLKPHLLFAFPFSNLPTHVIAFLWANTMRQIDELGQRIRSADGVKSVTTNVLQIGYIFDTWRDALVETGAGPE